MATVLRVAMAPLHALAWLALATLVLAALALIGLSFFLGPALVAPLPLLALGVLALEPVFRQRGARAAVAAAQAAGATGPITVWGRVTRAVGTCPTGPMPGHGTAFAVARDEVWPGICEHARAAVLQVADRMARGESFPDVPIYVHDASHEIEIELHHERAPVLPPLAQLKVVELSGVCPRGYRVGDVFACTPSGEVSPSICPVAARALQPLLASMVQGRPGAPRSVVCPIREHMLVLQLEGAAA